MIKTVTDSNGNRHQIDIDDDIAWLVPYLVAAKRLGIPIWRLDRIKGYYVPLDKNERQYAAVLRDADSPNRKMTMTVLKYHQTLVRTSGHYETGYASADEKHYFERTILTFAHELSHLIHWEHTANRFVLESKLYKAFAHLARKRGYQGYV